MTPSIGVGSQFPSSAPSSQKVNLATLRIARSSSRFGSLDRPANSRRRRRKVCSR